MTTFNESDRP